MIQFISQSPNLILKNQDSVFQSTELMFDGNGIITALCGPAYALLCAFMRLPVCERPRP